MRGFKVLGVAAKATPGRTGLVTSWAIDANSSRICCIGDRIPFQSNRTIATAARAQQPPSTPSNTPPTPSPTSHHATATADQFRALMRLLPHSVVVCTSLDPHPHTPTPSSSSLSSTTTTNQKPSYPRAMTMSSLTSLSISPTPLVSFNIKKPSRTLDALRSSGRFNVHVLRDDVRGSRIAEWFSRGDAGKDPFEGVEGCGCVVERGDGGVELRGEGVRRVLRCRVEELLSVRDHVIVVGEVEEIRGDGGEEGDAEGLGLAYADRRYRRAGEVIQKHVE
ncbi:Flavin reductase like domain-containing protein [Scedosporium apiospermum]|uniref:Flavin reductase like domain-containing protein n=1 Tax=Pseudallescheria apiosperma TaxID=563466 RepID=A0A084GH50_PSEDA|nr:Flavin reductase like domain-containing protein [Scedosporium apiospermum]KEZ46662.1 Flavin reductase like domain-containing protein [Scedosporium apiospermum]